MTAKSFIHRCATIGLAASREAAEALFGSAWERGPLCRLLYYGIDLAPFRAKADPSVRAALQLAPDALVIGHVGRFDEQKNHRFLLEIFRSVADADLRARLLLIGDGRLRQEIVRRASEMGLAERVVFTGVRTDVPKLLLNAVDILVMPSLYEGLPLVCLEAQAAGVRCLLANTISREADVVPQLMKRVPLSQPASTWARVALEIRHDARRIRRTEALALLENSPFNICRSVSQLTWLYETAVDPSLTGAADFRPMVTKAFNYGR